MAKKAVEQTGLIPRSIIRTFDRFRKQLFLETENLIIQEFRISRYQFLVSIKCLASLIFIPLGVNYLLKNFLLIPLTETFWNNKQSEIFLNSYQQQQAFNELKKFQEKLYFEYLLNNQVNFPFNINKEFKNNSVRTQSLRLDDLLNSTKHFTGRKTTNLSDYTGGCFKQTPQNFQRRFGVEKNIFSPKIYFISETCEKAQSVFLLKNFQIQKKNFTKKNFDKIFFIKEKIPCCVFFKDKIFYTTLEKNLNSKKDVLQVSLKSCKKLTPNKLANVLTMINELKTKLFFNNCIKDQDIWFFTNETVKVSNLNFINNNINYIALSLDQHISEDTIKNLIKNKIVELAIYYNHQSILALTNLVGDFITFLVLSLVIMYMKPQISILKSFLTESIYSLNDTKKSFLLILGTDLLVGFHSPRGWEICLELLLRHFGFPENKDFVFLFVASFPVLLDTVFKYWIFRYLNKISPSTVATYHNMIE